MDLTFGQVVTSVLNTLILVVQFLVYRYIRKTEVSADRSNAQAVTDITENLNRLYKSVHIALEARGLGVGAEPGVSPSEDGVPLTEADRQRMAAMRKAEMFRSAKNRRV